MWQLHCLPSDDDDDDDDGGGGDDDDDDDEDDDDGGGNDDNINCLMTSLVVSVRSVSPWQQGNDVVQVLSPHF